MSHSPCTSSDFNWLGGFIADLPTPFGDHNQLDLAALELLCEHQIAAGASALVVGETAGEASTLTPREHDALIREAVAIADGRIRVIAGAGSNSTCQAVELTRRAQLAGADAVMSVVPYCNKPTQAGIKAHFRAVAGSTSLPLILHDNAGRCVSAMTDATVVRLALLPGFVGLRDTSHDITRLLRLRRVLPPGFRLLGGDDTTAVAVLMRGGDGCVCNMAGVVPDLCRAIMDACRCERFGDAASLCDQLAPLSELLASDTTSATLKYALGARGLMTPHVRLPIVSLDDRAKIAVDRAIDAVCPNHLASRSA